MDFEFEYIRPGGEPLMVTGTFQYSACGDCGGRFHNHIDEIEIESVIDEAGKEIVLEDPLEEAKMQLKAVAVAYEVLGAA